MRYGKRSIRAELPSGVEPVELLPPIMEASWEGSRGEGDGAVVREALGAATGSPALEDLARRSNSALVVIPDKTRAAGVREYLPPVLEALADGGLDERSVRIITANGAHRLMTEEELIGLMGPEIYARYRPLQHDSKDASRVRHLGSTSRGTAVAVNNACLEAELLVVTGAVSFHYFAGFGGGRKLLFPGLAGYDSIVENHRLTLGPGEGLHPRCRSGNLEGNPVHEDIMEAFAMLPPPFVLTTVVAPHGPVIEAFAGEHDSVFSEACASARRHFGLRARGKASLVIASCGGHPWDINLLQLHKSLRHAAAVARDGGALVLAGEAGEGVGSETLEKGLVHSSWREADKAARTSYVLNAHTAVSLLREAERLSLHLVSSLGGDCSGANWASFHDTAQGALEGALHDLRFEAGSAYFMPLAAITVPEP